MIDLRPDPRISNLPPAWLSSRSDWSDLLQPMSREDVDWIGDQWKLAGGGSHAVRTDSRSALIRFLEDWPWPLMALLGVPIVAIIVGFILRAFGVQT